MVKQLFRRLGIALSSMCGIALGLSVGGILPGYDWMILHQSGVRWLAEGTVAGLLLAAVGFWEPD